jgi:hypothetical protein
MMVVYQIYHLNLMFSSIEENKYSDVIVNCYWPLLKLADYGIPIGIEVSGVTLEIIEKIDKSWIDKFAELLKSSKVELVASGYSQIIGPLVPALMTEWNIKLGLEVYTRLLDTRPSIVLINEMASSQGLIDLYEKHGFKSVVLEWNNLLATNNNVLDSDRFKPQLLKSRRSARLRALWADSISFQQFQRYVHCENTLEVYLKFFDNYYHEPECIVPLYTSDAEVFGFRPGRYKTESNTDLIKSEWSRIMALYDVLKQRPTVKFVLPSEALNHFVNIKGEAIVLGNSNNPVLVKKQPKYNIIRWALTGRDDLWLNTNCFLQFKRIHDSNDNEEWRKLAYLWSSDFRTHITDLRWAKLEKLIDRINPESRELGVKDSTWVLRGDDVEQKEVAKRYRTMSNNLLSVTFDLWKGGVITSFSSINEGMRDLFGTISHGYVSDINWAADFYSGHSIIERFGEHKIADLNKLKGFRFLKSDHSPIFFCSDLIEGIRFSKKIILNEKSLNIKSRIELPSRKKQVIYPLVFTFDLKNWHCQSLYYATHNGGEELESFSLHDTKVYHGRAHSLLVTANNAPGCSQGKIIIGDKHKSLSFQIDQDVSALIPYVRVINLGNKSMLKLMFSSQEVDDTFREHGNLVTIDSSVTITLNSNI